MDDQHVRIGLNDADGSKIFDRVVGRAGRQRNDRDLRRGSHQQHMSVGRRTGDRFGRERTGRRRAILDHELLPKRVAERLRDQTGNAVGISPRREGNHDLDRLLRPNLRACGGHRARNNEHGQCRQKHAWRLRNPAERFRQCQVR